MINASSFQGPSALLHLSILLLFSPAKKYKLQFLGMKHFPQSWKGDKVTTLYNNFMLKLNEQNKGIKSTLSWKHRKTVSQQQQNDFWPVIMAKKKTKNKKQKRLSEIFSGFCHSWGGRIELETFLLFWYISMLNYLCLQLISTINHYCTNKLITWW